MIWGWGWNWQDVHIKGNGATSAIGFNITGYGSSNGDAPQGIGSISLIGK